MTIFRRLCATLCAGLTLLFLSTRALASFEVMVPAYFYPGGYADAGPLTAGGADWAALASAASAGYKVTAILNPASGPGTALDPNYLSAAYGVRCGVCSQVLGFVYTRYAERPIEQVKADIDRYYELYPVSGIFLDEMVSEYMLGAENQTYKGPTGDIVTIKSAATYLAYYSELYRYIQTKTAASPFVKPNGTPVATGTRVVGNVGINAAEITLTGGKVGNVTYGKLADDVIVLEQSYDFLVGNVAPGAEKYVVSEWNKSVPGDYRDNLGYLIHTTPTSAAAANALATIAADGGGIAYVTNAGLGPDTFSQLSPYWSMLLANCTYCPPATVPEPSSGALLAILGVAAIASRRRRALAAVRA